jgi:exopolysaccharide production protein ExoF
MSEALAQSNDASRFDPQNAASISYSIVREIDGQSKEVPVTENSTLQPGDLIRVTAGVAMR